MIHNFEKEKDRPQGNQDAPVFQLGEEELRRLTSQVEAEELLSAPACLKEQIMTHIRVQKQKRRKKRVWGYRMQVLTAMAAALTVLILVPAEISDWKKISLNWFTGQETVQQSPLEERAHKKEREIEEWRTQYQAQREWAYESQKFWARLTDSLTSLNKKAENEMED